MKASAKDELFKYLVAYNTKHGCLPTQQEIAADLGRNRSTISRHMQKISFCALLFGLKEKMMAMTRKEAISKCHGIAYPEVFIQALEALGLLKFEQEKAIVINHIDKGPIIVQRNGKVVYTELDD